MKPKAVQFDHRREYDIACNKEDARHKKVRDRLKETLKELQSRCKHESLTFQDDPAGGSDSCNICDTCDKRF